MMDSPHKYMAASVPRHIRTSRLGYLRRDAVIGSIMHQSGMVYDVIMLPAAEFVRARNHLSAQGTGLVTLERGRMDAPYIPQDTKEMTVLPGESDPRLVAVKYFRNHFNLPEGPSPHDPDEPAEYTPFVEV